MAETLSAIGRAQGTPRRALRRGQLRSAGLVRGKSVDAILAVLDATAKPVTAAGRPASWSEPGVRVATWRGRRMPPFAGTAAEKRALAIHLARLGGDERAGLEAPAGRGAEAFERHCSACHGPESSWPITDRLRGRAGLAATIPADGTTNADQPPPEEEP